MKKMMKNVISIKKRKSKKLHIWDAKLEHREKRKEKRGSLNIHKLALLVSFRCCFCPKT